MRPPIFSELTEEATTADIGRRKMLEVNDDKWVFHHVGLEGPLGDTQEAVE